MALVICPYCFRKQPRNELSYRCPSSCSAEKGGARVFSPAELTADGRCPHQRHPQARRLCAGCGRDLLREYVDGLHHMIALVGAPGAGKSTFVGVLVHELRGPVGDRFGTLALDLLGEDSRMEYSRLLERPLYRDGRMPGPTPAAGARSTGRHDPLMMALRWKSKRRMPLRANAVNTTRLVLYDTAGEDLKSTQSTDRLNDYLAAATGVVMMVDTAALLAGAFDDVDPLESVQVVTEQLRELAHLQLPVAVVFSKIDIATAGGDDEFGSSSPLRRASRHDGYFDELDSRDVHEEIRAWLASHGLGNLDRTLTATFSDYRYFGVSALGHAPRNGTSVTISQIRPYRVEDPLLWLLTRFGTAPGNGRRQ
jgi:GTPase SAR1 family protein